MIVEQYITRHPKLEASKELKKIVARLTSTTDTMIQPHKFCITSHFTKAMATRLIIPRLFLHSPCNIHTF